MPPWSPMSTLFAAAPGGGLRCNRVGNAVGGTELVQVAISARDIAVETDGFRLEKDLAVVGKLPDHGDLRFLSGDKTVGACSLADNLLERCGRYGISGQQERGNESGSSSEFREFRRT